MVSTQITNSQQLTELLQKAEKERLMIILWPSDLPVGDKPAGFVLMSAKTAQQQIIQGG